MGLLIGTVAKMSKTSVDTIRFYEKNGLIPPLPDGNPATVNMRGRP